MAIRTGVGLAVLSCVLGCSSLDSMPPADHVVGAPISNRANVVLKNLVEEYGSSDGRWQGCMSPGCTPIWAAQFGYRAGVRRDRDDVIAAGSPGRGERDVLPLPRGDRRAFANRE